jgi:murein DD-endopeptidase MepM/ murein hydrolase activator NlpD/predicted negative regulator of RcsB-dependent stress response
MNRASDEPATQLWQDLSELVLRARVEGRAIEANAALEHYIREDPKGPTAPAMAVWRADNFVLDRHFDKGARAHQEVARRHEHDRIRDVSWATYALDQAAYCHEQCGNVDNALKALSAILAVKEHGPKAWIHYRRGRVLEAASRDADAIDAYREAARSRDKASTSGEPIPDLARRAAERLSQAEKLEAFPDRLAMQITRALRRRDAAALAQLASKTHFAVGVAGAEMMFIDYAKVAGRIKGDLAHADLRADPAALQGKGQKLYLYTDDWQGHFLRGRVYFLLTRARDGWQWSGLVLTQASDAYFELFPPAPPATNQLPQLPIKAPFPRGVCFRAGGLRRFLSSFAPFFGQTIFLPDLLSRCGYGPGGFYYNEGTTHHGQDAFAIDFTRYRTGIPYYNGAGGIPALAVQWGIVTSVRSSIASGDSSLPNYVQVDHPSPAEVLGLIFGIPLPSQLKYRSRYLHLAGPGAVLVSPGMYVRQGAQLGPINDTGNSAFDHLHFSLHDRDLVADGVPYQSMRPTPMDGQPLEDRNRGACVCSSNVAFP